ncbi:MAG: glycoside hydrolase family 38 C-terminal domain-containing protein [bacterium]
MSNKRKIFLILNFHCTLNSDKPFQKNRIDFVYLIDKIIDTLNNDYKYKSITFNGQSSFLEDYLEIRPEMERDLKRLISEKRLVVGPWYMLPNEYLISPESIIRNLMLGHITAESFGNVMKVGYSRNSFGLISQLPQILKGFDIDTLIINNYNELKSRFLWYSADNKTSIFTINLHDNIIKLNKDFDTDKLIYNIKNCNDNIIVNDFCSLNIEGTSISNLIENINDNFDDIKVINGSFSDYIENTNLKELKLTEYYGEIKNSNHSSSIALSSRMYLKQLNTETQLLIEKWLEPFCTLNWLENGKPYPKAFIWYAWKCLIRNHSYYDINGCSIDEVYHDSMIRYEWAKQIGEQLIHSALKDMADNITPLPQRSFVVFNPLAWERTDPINLELRTLDNPQQIVVKNTNGEKVPSQVIKKEETYELSLQTQIPALGYACYYIETEKQAINSFDTIKISPRVMENQHYRIKINGNGILDILDKSTGYEYKGLNVYEDTEYFEDYNFSINSKQAKIYTNRGSKADVRIFNNGAIKAEAEIRLSMNLPKGLTRDKKSRTAAKLSCPLITKITLYSKFPRIDFAVIFENKVENHCLRVMFPINLKVKAVNVDGHFDVISRIIDEPKDKADHFRQKDHQNFFIDFSDGKKGIALINKGLPEYEIVKAKDRCILYLTLLRCIGYSKDLAIPTPSAQCHGIHKFYYSIILHKGDWISAEIQRRAYEYNLPVMAIFDKQGEGVLPKSQSFISVEPPQLVVTALKKCELGDGVILRLFNSTNENIEGIIKTHKPISHACLTNLNEQPLTNSELRIDKTNIFLKVNQKEIKTIKLNFQGDENV